MPKFRDKEEYERWKAQRQQELREKGQSPSAPESPEIKGPGDQNKQAVRESVPPRREAADSGGELAEIGDLFRHTWDVYKRRVGPLISLYLLSFVLFVAAVALFAGAGFLLSLILEGARTALIAAGAVTGVLGGTVILFWGGAAVVCAVADETLGFGESLAAGWQKVWAFCWFFSLTGFIITGGFLLFFVPGVVFLVWFAFGQFLVANGDARGMNALLKSKKYVEGHWFDVFVRLFLVWLVSAGLGIIPFVGPLLSLLAVPFMLIFSFLLFEDLKSVKGPIDYVSSPGEKLKWLGAGTLGYLVTPLIVFLLLGATVGVPLMLLKNMLASGGKEFSVSPGIFSGQEKDVEGAYLAYRQAFLAGDIESMKGLVAKEKAGDLEGAQAPSMIEMAKAFSPKKVSVTGIRVEGETATLSVSGDNHMTGTIRMQREDGSWKLLNEEWQMKMDMAGEGTTAPQQEAAVPENQRPYDYAKAVGVWKGREEGSSGDEWVFTLRSDYQLSAVGPDGRFYKGTAVAKMDLGLEGDGLRVLPGGAIFDVLIEDASEAGSVGKLSLGSFKLVGGLLQICGSEPGLLKRTSDFASRSGIRCFALQKTEDLPPAPAPEQPVQPMTSRTQSSPFSEQDTGISGEAVVVKDGVTETYPLRSGFFSETGFADPSRARVQFRAPASEHGNARRIEMVLDATKTGAHFADGKILSENFMSSDTIRIGEPTPNGLSASFRWVADGGQIFWPNPSCIITVTSAYAGTATSTFSGEVADCPVHSAGIDYHISSVRFTVRGASKR